MVLGDDEEIVEVWEESHSPRAEGADEHPHHLRRDEGAVAPPEAERDHGDVPPLLLLQIAKESPKIEGEELLMVGVDRDREVAVHQVHRTEEVSHPGQIPQTLQRFVLAAFLSHVGV